MIWITITVLLLLWLIGVLGSIGGALVHMLLLLVGIAFLVQFVTVKQLV